jgi:hypothetical protein
MFGCFDKVAVLEYDRCYRTYQAAASMVWGTNIPHLDTMTLTPSLASTKPPPRYGQTRSYPKDSRSTMVQDSGPGNSQRCHMYNSMQGCKFGNRCHYQHKCLRCNGGYPQIVHGPPPPVTPNVGAAASTATATGVAMHAPQH